MPTTISLIGNTDQTSSSPSVFRKAISADHFGGNLLITHAQPGAPLSATSPYGQAIQQLGMGTLRYPGGTVTEEHFSMAARNASANGATPLIPQSEFLAYAAQTGAAVNFVIPTRDAFGAANTAAIALQNNTYGSRTVDAAYLATVREYVRNSLADAYNANPPVTVKSFEIGNEFWASGQMTATEYGKVANAVLQAAQLGINDAIQANTVSANTQPDLLVQTLRAAGYMSPNGPKTVYIQNGEVTSGPPSSGSYTTAEIASQGSARDQLNAILDQLTTTSRALIDGVVDHYYPERGLDVVDAGEQYIFDQFDYFEDAIGVARGTLDRYVTEWNTQQSGATDNRGLSQAAMMVEMFYEMATHGVTAANVWPIWQAGVNSTNLLHKDSFALRVPGAIFQLMQESLIGRTALFDATQTVGAIKFDTHGFSDSRGLVLFASNRSTVVAPDIVLDLNGIGDATLQAKLDNASYFVVLTELSATLNGVANTGASGQDVTPVLTYSNGFVGTGDDIALSALDLPNTAAGVAVQGIVRVEITYITGGADVVQGRSGNDLVTGAGGNDTLRGAGGNDTLYGANDADSLLGEAGNDVLYGDAGNDRVFGGTENDSILGGAGLDMLYGDEGDDTINGETDNDQLFGGDGNDSILGDAGNDTLSGSFGLDTLRGGAGADNIDGGRHNDQIFGGNDNDTLTGGREADTVYGGDGNDLVQGGRENDFVYGDAGADTVLGDSGLDTLSGGLGNDRFVFNLTTDGMDTISDFSNVAGNDDTIAISTAFGGGLTAGVLAASRFQSLTVNTAVDADDRFIFRTTDKTLWFDADGSGAGASVHVATLTIGTLTAADILII